MSEIKTIADVEAEAARLGITLTADDYAAANALADQRRTDLEVQYASEGAKTGTAALVERFNRFYPKFLQALIGVSDVMIAAAQTVLTAFGVPALLIMLMIVEQQRVALGITLFEATGPLADFSATVLVLANLVFELLISWKEHQSGYAEPIKHEFSLRLMAQRATYMFGRSNEWQPRTKSPAQRFRAVLRVITFTILTLAAAGSMRSVIEQTSGTWIEAIWHVIAASSLSQMFTWIGGLLVAVAFVRSAQALSQYVAQKVIEIVAAMKTNADDRPRAVADAAGLTAAMFLYGRLKDAQRQRRYGAAQAAELSDGSRLALPVTVSRDTVTNGVTRAAANQVIALDDSVTGAAQTKLDRARDILRDDPALARVSLRALEDRYPDIGRNVWGAAKKSPLETSINTMTRAKTYLENSPLQQQGTLPSIVEAVVENH